MAKGGAAGPSRDGASPPLERIGPFGPTHPARYRVVPPNEQAVEYHGVRFAPDVGFGVVPLSPQSFPVHFPPQAWLGYGGEAPPPPPAALARDRPTRVLDADRD